MLTGKGKLADYPGDYQKGEPHLEFGELHGILLKNKGRLGVSLNDAGLVERLRREYEESLEQVLPLKERLAKTDALIDAVVYRLYGLTEEEIGVVEGRANLARGCLRNLGSDPGTAPLPTSFSYTQDAKAHWKIDMGFLMI